MRKLKIGLTVFIVIFALLFGVFYNLFQGPTESSVAVKQLEDSAISYSMGQNVSKLPLFVYLMLVIYLICIWFKEIKGG